MVLSMNGRSIIVIAFSCLTSHVGSNESHIHT